MSKKLRKRQQQRKKRQKVIWIIGAGLVLIASAVFVAVRNPSQINSDLIEIKGQAAVKVDPEVIDYGYVKLGRNLTFDITVTNIGDQTLRFNEKPYVEVLEGC